MHDSDQVPVGRNGLIPCRPVAKFAPDKQEKSGFATIRVQGSLVEVVVVYEGWGQDGAPYRPGDRVYLDRDQANGQPWGKKIYKVGADPVGGGKDERPEFILVPAQFVLLHAAAKVHQPAAPKILGKGPWLNGRPEGTPSTSGDGSKVLPFTGPWRGGDDPPPEPRAA